MKIATTLLCSWLFMIILGLAGAHADERSCEGIKRALVSSNLAFMRIERGPLPVSPGQASLAIGQMTALMNLAPLACSPEDADKIGLVVMPRRDALQLLLPSPAETEQTPVAADQAPAPDTNAMRTEPPSPPPRPLDDTHSRQSARGSFSAATCTRVYYMKGKYRYWRCKR